MNNQEAVTTSQKYVEQGKTLVQALQFTPAQKLFQKSLELDPQSIQAKIWLARIALISQRKERAQQYLDQILSSQLNNAEALALKGILRMTETDWKGAINDLENARQADPSLQMIYYNLAKSHRKLGNFSEAEKFARKAIELNDKDFSSHSELSYVLGRTGRIKEGVQEMSTALRINPYFITGYLVLATVYKVGKRPDRAITLLKEGLSRNANAIPLHEELANLYALSGDYKSAYRETLEIMKRRNIWADFLRLGCYALGINDAKRAEEAFRRAKEQLKVPAEPQEVIRKICGNAQANHLYESADKLWNQVSTSVGSRSKS